MEMREYVVCLVPDGWDWKKEASKRGGHAKLSLCDQKIAYQHTDQHGVFDVGDKKGVISEHPVAQKANLSDIAD